MLKDESSNPGSSDPLGKSLETIMSNLSSSVLKLEGIVYPSWMDAVKPKTLREAGKRAHSFASYAASLEPSDLVQKLLNGELTFRNSRKSMEYFMEFRTKKEAGDNKFIVMVDDDVRATSGYDCKSLYTYYGNLKVLGGYLSFQGEFVSPASTYSREQVSKCRKRMVELARSVTGELKKRRLGAEFIPPKDLRYGL